MICGQLRWRGVLALLLCLLLISVAVHSPHCDLCDTIAVVAAGPAHAPVAGHGHAAPLDDCNGLCSCCGFHGLPRAYGVVIAAVAVDEMRPIDPQRMMSSRHLTLFRPPRLLSL